MRSRRFARWMVVALFLLMALVTVLEFRDTAKPTAASIAEAKGVCSATFSGSYSIDGDGNRTFYDEAGDPVDLDLTQVPVVRRVRHRRRGGEERRVPESRAPRRAR